MGGFKIGERHFDVTVLGNGEISISTIREEKEYMCRTTIDEVQKFFHAKIYNKPNAGLCVLVNENGNRLELKRTPFHEIESLRCETCSLCWGLVILYLLVILMIIRSLFR